MEMTKTNRILVWALVALVVLLLALLLWQKLWGVPSYYAVYLRTGDVYFGKLVHFPVFGLQQVYLLQANQGNQQNPLSVQKFSNLFWGPEDFIRINREEVVWMVRLRSDSQLSQLFAANPNLVSPSQEQGQQTSPPQNLQKPK